MTYRALTTIMKVIQLFGFEAHNEGVDEYELGYDVDHANRSVDVPGQLRAAIAGAEVSDYAVRRLIIWNDSGKVESSKSVPESKSLQDG